MHLGCCPFRRLICGLHYAERFALSRGAVGERRGAGAGLKAVQLVEQMPQTSSTGELPGGGARYTRPSRKSRASSSPRHGREPKSNLAS